MTVYIGADHNGFEFKTMLCEHLAHAGYQVEDVGAHKLDPQDDFPQYAFATATKVLGGGADDVGILICASGQGMAMAANRVRGIRAAIAWSAETAVHARRDDNANVLVLASRYTDTETMLAAVDAYLATEFSDNPKYQRRLDELEQLYG